MGWHKTDDNMHAHRKTRRAGLEAMGLWIVSASWASQQNTEGFVPEWFVEGWPKGKALATKLVSAGFWTEAVDDGEAGWQFHDWLDYNPAAEEENRRKKAAAERQRKHRRDKAGRYVTGAVTRDNMRDNMRDITRESHSLSHHPDPARPDPTPGTTLGGDLTGGSAHGEPPLYPGRCSQHGDVAEPGPCGGCADVRKAGRPVLALVKSRRCLVHQLSHDGVCSGCAADEKAAN